MDNAVGVMDQGNAVSLRNAETVTRYHGLDALRAAMMLLGIYLHVVVGYTGDGRWPYIDPHPAHGINVTLGVIHSFRMPAFYVMAGFFGALLWDRRGVAGFVSNRAKRVLVPFVLFWWLLFPPIAVAVISLERGVDQVIPVFTSGVILKRLHPMHLWFLEYLLLLYLIAAVGVHLCAVSRSPEASDHDGLSLGFAALVCPAFSAHYSPGFP